MHTPASREPVLPTLHLLRTGDHHCELAYMFQHVHHLTKTEKKKKQTAETFHKSPDTFSPVHFVFVHLHAWLASFIIGSTGTLQER